MNPRLPSTRSLWPVSDRASGLRALTVALAAMILLLIGAVIALANSGDPAVGWWVISGSGAPSSGTGVTLDDTLGQPIIGATGGGDITLRDGYWVACVAAPAVAPIVTVACSGADVVLTWMADPANARYQVWVSTDPYLDPDNPGGVTPIVTADTTYTDTGAAASLINHFYVVRGLNACAVASANSARVGEFTFGLTPGN